MRFLSIVFIFYTILLHQSADVRAELNYSKKGKNLILSGGSCSELESEFEYLQAWSKRLANSANCQLKSQVSDNQCHVDVSDCVPPMVLTSLDKAYAPETKGFYGDSPNCFGLAMQTAGFAKDLNFARPEEIYEYLKPPLCQKLTGNTAPQAGDLGILKRAGDVTHAFTYISQQTVWNKSGGGSNQLPFFQNSKEMLTGQQWADECHICKNVKPGEKNFEACSFCQTPFVTEYYHCNNVAETLNESRKRTDKILQMKLQELDQVSCRSSQLFFKPGALTRESALNLNQSLLALAQYFHDEDTKNPIAKPPKTDRDWQLTLLSLRLSSLELSTETATSVVDEAHSLDFQNKIQRLLIR